MRRGIARLLVMVLLWSLLDPAFAVNWYVRKDGHDTNCNGKTNAAAGVADPNCAFLTIQKAADANIVAGDTLTIREGVYKQSVLWAKSGSAGSLITVQGDPNEAVVIQSTNHKSISDPNSWDVISPLMTAFGIYRYDTSVYDANGVDPNGTVQRVYGYVSGMDQYVNERVGLIPYKYKRDFMSRNTDYYVDSNGAATVPYYAGPGTWLEKRCDTGGGTWGAFCDSSTGCSPGTACKYTGFLLIRMAKTPEMKEYEARYGEVFPTADPYLPPPPDDTIDPNALGRNPHPGDYAIDFSKDDYTLKINASYTTFKHLTVEVAKQSILYDPNAIRNGNTLDDVTVWIGDDGVRYTGSGDPNSLIDNSRIYGDVPRWLTWTDAKENPKVADLMRPDAISIDGTADDIITVDHTHVRGGHDGFSTAASQTGLVFSYNRVENMADDAFEIEGNNLGSVSVYGNFILNCLTAFAPGQDSTGITGPILFYRNVASLLQTPLVNREGKERDGTCSKTECSPPCSAAGCRTAATWNGSFRRGHEYALKNNGPNTFYYHNTFAFLGGPSKGVQIMSGRSLVPCNDCYSMDNLLIGVNGPIQGATSDYGATGEVINYNAYYKVNNAEVTSPLWGARTASEVCVSRGYECNGLLLTTPPLASPTFDPDSGLWDKTVSDRWELVGGWSEFPLITDFIPSSSSPIILSGAAPPVHGTFGTLPDLYSSNLTIGAFPHDVDPNTLLVFPFIRANPVGPPQNPGGGGSGSNPRMDIPQ